MAIGIVGRKRGMTRVFTQDGASIPVTVIEAQPNRVTQVKTEENDGYRAVQVTTGYRRPSRVTKPEAGHVAKAGVEMGRGLWEFRLDASADATFTGGDEIAVDQFEAGALVDVVGQTKGKGFQGTIKRHNFSGQRNTHGNNKSHRKPGSIGMAQDPGHVLKGKRMAGHMGDARRTVHNIEVVRVDEERNLILVKGAIPGAREGDVIVRPAVKAASKGEA
jgi:large subunit ribosomal protein L3